MKKSILIIEDDEFLIDSYTMQFEEAGYTVVIERNGEEGLHRATTEPYPNLIILDLVMPKKSGISFLEEFSKMPIASTIPVLVATNIDQEATAKECLGLGAKEYFIKSNISIQDLVRKADSYIVA